MTMPPLFPIARHSAACLFAALALANCMPLTALAQQAPSQQETAAGWTMRRLSLGVDYIALERPDQANRRILSIPLIASFANDPWTASISASWLSVTRRDNQMTGGDLEDVVTGPGVTQNGGQKRGLGDVVLNLSRDVTPWEAGRWNLRLGGFVKFPTAPPDLGSNRADIGAQADLAYASTSGFLPFTSASWRLTGKRKDLAMRNTFSGLVGIQRSLGGGDQIGAYLSYRQSVYQTTDDYPAAYLYGTKRLNRHWSTQAYLSLGMGPREGEKGFGLALRYAP
jgi:hypothetical protein